MAEVQQVDLANADRMAAIAGVEMTDWQRRMLAAALAGHRCGEPVRLTIQTPRGMWVMRSG